MKNIRTAYVYLTGLAPNPDDMMDKKYCDLYNRITDLRVSFEEYQTKLNTIISLIAIASIINTITIYFPL